MNPHDNIVGSDFISRIFERNMALTYSTQSIQGQRPKSLVRIVFEVSVNALNNAITIIEKGILWPWKYDTRKLRAFLGCFLQ